MVPILSKITEYVLGTGIDDYIRYERKGSTELIKAKRIESEVLQCKINGKKKWFYLGVYPQFIERSTFMGLKKHKARLYFAREGEPFARDSYTGEYADDDKMWQAMLSKGAIDEFGFLLHDEKGLPYHGKGEDQEVIDQETYDDICNKLKKGKEPPEVCQKLTTLDSFLEEYDKKLFTFEDVSKMEYLLEEALLLTEGKVAQGLADAARREFISARDITMWLLIGFSFSFSALIFYMALKGAGYDI
ncbi:MAG: hypothetical protein ACFFCW_13565 [Candidatus Hodarchaeota archaeon]